MPDSLEWKLGARGIQVAEGSVSRYTVQKDGLIQHRVYCGPFSIATTLSMEEGKTVAQQHNDRK